MYVAITIYEIIIVSFDKCYEWICIQIFIFINISTISWQIYNKWDSRTETDLELRDEFIIEQCRALESYGTIMYKDLGLYKQFEFNAS